MVVLNEQLNVKFYTKKGTNTMLIPSLFPYFIFTLQLLRNYSATTPQLLINCTIASHTSGSDHF